MKPAAKAIGSPPTAAISLTVAVALRFHLHRAPW